MFLSYRIVSSFKSKSFKVCVRSRKSTSLSRNYARNHHQSTGLSMVRTTSATGAGGMAGMSLDSAELDSKADVDEPVE